MVENETSKSGWIFETSFVLNSRPTFVPADDQIRRIGFYSFCKVAWWTYTILSRYYFMTTEQNIAKNCGTVVTANSEPAAVVKKRWPYQIFVFVVSNSDSIQIHIHIQLLFLWILFKYYNFLKIDDTSKTLICGYIVGWLVGRLVTNMV